MLVFPDESHVFLDDAQAFQASIAVRVQNSVEGRIASGYGYPVVSGHDYSDSRECGTDAGPRRASALTDLVCNTLGQSCLAAWRLDGYNPRRACRQEASATNFQVGKPERGTHARREPDHMPLAGTAASLVSRGLLQPGGRRRLRSLAEFGSLGQFRALRHRFFCLAPLGLGVVGCVLGIRPVARGPSNTPPRGTPLEGQNQQDLFIRAQSQYLRGHWVEAQMLLEQLIRRDPGDVEAHLLLASVYRRARRIDLSRRQLRQVQDCAGAAKWRFEIGRELAAVEKPSALGA